jgi:hypothetical protein
MLLLEMPGAIECDEQREKRHKVNALEASSSNAMKQVLKAVVEVQYTTVILGAAG